MVGEILLVLGVLANIVVSVIMISDDKWNDIRFELDRHGSISMLYTLTIVVFLPAFLGNFLLWWIVGKITSGIKFLRNSRVNGQTLRSIRIPRFSGPKFRLPFRR